MAPNFKKGLDSFRDRPDPLFIMLIDLAHFILTKRKKNYLIIYMFKKSIISIYSNIIYLCVFLLYKII